MSSNDNKFLSEVDKLVMKLDEIIIAIKGEEGVINYKNVKDGFDRLRFEINDELKSVETLLQERDKILTSTVPKEIYERRKLEAKLEEKLDQIDGMMKKLNIELKAQKKEKEQMEIKYEKKKEEKEQMKIKYEQEKEQINLKYEQEKEEKEQMKIK